MDSMPLACDNDKTELLLREDLFPETLGYVRYMLARGDGILHHVRDVLLCQLLAERLPGSLSVLRDELIRNRLRSEDERVRAVKVVIRVVEADAEQRVFGVLDCHVRNLTQRDTTKAPPEISLITGLSPSWS